MKLSVVCPAHNEEKAIFQTLQEVQAALKSLRSLEAYEIIVIDDGSKDSTVDEAARLDGIRICPNKKNMGYGASLKKGIKLASYEYVLIIDADGTYPLDQLEQMLEVSQSSSMVVGERNLKFFEYPFARRVAKWILRSLVFLITGRWIRDLNSGLRILKKGDIINFFPIISDGFSFTTTVTLACFQNKLPVTYIPIEYRKRAGKSKIRPIRDTFRMIMLIFRNIMFFGPLRVFMLIAAVLFACTLATMSIDVFGEHNLTDKTVLLFVASSAFFFAGLIADLIHKKFEILEKKIDSLKDTPN